VNDTEAQARLLGRSAAMLIVFSLLTGFLVAGAMTGKLDADPHAMLASHLNALLGAFWMIGVAWSLPLLRFDAIGRTRLAWLTIVPNYANWIVTAVKSFLKVAGVEASADGRNNVIFGLLTAFVVLPSLAGACLWVWGFGRKPAT
jgi:(hydroxyamino)benzene mutase